jgi:hypothetical protein
LSNSARQWIRGGLWLISDHRTRLFRHTYCAERLQTLDVGAPVSIYTVARALGSVLAGGSAVERAQ